MTEYPNQSAQFMDTQSGFEQDYREAEQQRKALKTYTDRFAAIACAIQEYPSEREQLLSEFDLVTTNYYRDKIAGRFGT